MFRFKFCNGDHYQRLFENDVKQYKESNEEL